ncbi:hypothetical protein DsansV1_C09g0089061 [Dioscorea sansibarensis]
MRLSFIHAEDADQLFENRVRSWFSHWKMFFVPLTAEDLKVMQVFEPCVIFAGGLIFSFYVKEFNSRMKVSFL